MRNWLQVLQNLFHARLQTVSIRLLCEASSRKRLPWCSDNSLPIPMMDRVIRDPVHVASGVL
jgi:hypothetical protein